MIRGFLETSLQGACGCAPNLRREGSIRSAQLKNMACERHVHIETSRVRIIVAGEGEVVQE